MKKLAKIAICASVLSGVLALQAETAKAGSCISKAIALKSSQTVTLVNEYDPEFKDFYDMGVCYYKITLNKGQSYTIWINGGSAADMTLSVDVNWALDDTPLASFDYEEYASGVKAAYMYADSWDEEDPSKFTYYVAIGGEIGQQTMLYYTSGIASFTQVGEESNPKRISALDTQATDSASLIEGDYYYIARLEAGRKYMFRTTGGTAGSPLGMSIDPASDYMQEDIPAYTNDANNTSWYVYPAVTQDYVINVSGVGTLSQSFKLKHRSYPSRLPSEHESVKLYQSEGYAATVVPGRMVGDTAYYDNVIDESLCRIKLPAGEKWVFETMDATNALRMVAYDASGNILRENTSIGNGSRDCRVAITTTYAGWYYVGVCRQGLEYWDERPEDGAVTVFAYAASDAGLPDDCDPDDDTYAGAELIDTFPAAVDSSVADAGSESKVHALNAGDWYDYFCFAARRGTTYSLKATFAGFDATTLRLAAKVYKMSNGALVKVSDTIGSISPDGTDEAVKALTFTADANAMYYVRVSVSDGVGLDYPEYKVHAVAYMADGTDLGLVQVNTKGVDSTWYLTDDSTALYLNGATIALPAGVQKNIRFSSVNGFSAPPKTPVVPAKWDGDAGSISPILGVYNDEFDPADDVESGYVAISPSSALAKAKRTLWTEDLADWFRFKSSAGYCYNFYLTDTTSGGVGDAVFAIKYYADTTNVISGVTECLKMPFDPREKGKYNLCVYHETVAKADTSYRLYYQAVNVGTVRFATTTPNVSESADFVDVVVQRTASEGAVRVNYATEAYTALPGKDYYPTNGVIEWADGDMSDKIIRVRLIPDLEEEWDAQLRFRIRLWPMSDDSLADDEYPVTIENDTATVKIKEMSTKSPGTISVADDDVRATAGDYFSLSIVRSGGSDGRVAVRVYTQQGTAVAGVDYTHVDTVFVWEDGEDDEKILQIGTLKTESLSSKQFNVKFVVQTTGVYADCDTPALAAKKVYLTLDSGIASKTFEEAAEGASAAGATLTASGTWYTDSSGFFRCAPPAGKSIKLNFEVAAPGFFIAQPVVNGVGLLRYMTTGSEWTECTGERLVIPVSDAGGTTVSFKLTQTDAASFVSFVPQSNGQPFKFVDVATVGPVDPENRSVVNVGSVEGLSWSAPLNSDGETIWYRVGIASDDEADFTFFDATKSTFVDGLAGYELSAGCSYRLAVECALSEGETIDPAAVEWISCPSEWTFATSSLSTPSTVVKPGYYDSTGEEIVNGAIVELAVGVPALFFVGADDGDAVSCTVLDGELPPGLSLYSTGKASKVGRIQGTPTQAGAYSVLMQVITAAGEAKTLRLNIDVAALGTVAGSYTGIVCERGGELVAAAPRIGRVTSLAITASGAASATVKVAGQKYKFTASGFDGIKTWRRYVTLYNTATVDGAICTNRLELTIDSECIDYSGEHPYSYEAGNGKLYLTVLDDGFAKEVVYDVSLVRDNTGDKSWLAAAAKFSGYYTVSLVPFGVVPSDGVPCGNGYITVTIDESGLAKFAGMLADGTAISGSSRVGIYGDLFNPGECEVEIPLGVYSDNWSFGGSLYLEHMTNQLGSAANVFISTTLLDWSKDGTGSSFDGQGFRLDLRPTGGWYNTLVNLQTYYLDRDFTVEAEAVDGVPAAMLPAGNTYTADTMPHGVNVTLGRSSLTPDQRVLVASNVNPLLYDLAASVNPWKVKTTFVPETGLLSGTFKAWSDGATQSQFATLNHYGVLLMNRDGKSPIEDAVWTAGFYLLPVSSTWSMSLPFNIRAVKVDRDWTEADVPAVE